MKKKWPASKKFVVFLFANCTFIQLFVCATIIAQFFISPSVGLLPDFSALTAIIGAVVGETVGYAVYALKSAKENTKDGIVYELAMMNAKNQNNIIEEELG